MSRAGRWLIAIAVVGFGAAMLLGLFLSFRAALQKGHRQVYLGDATWILLSRRAARGELPLTGTLRFDPPAPGGEGKDESWGTLSGAEKVAEGRTFRYIVFEGEVGKGRSFALFDEEFVQVSAGPL